MYLGRVVINQEEKVIQFDFQALDSELNQQIYLNMPPNYKPHVHLSGLWLKHNSKSEYDVDFDYGDTSEECYRKIMTLNNKCNLK